MTDCGRHSVSGKHTGFIERVGTTSITIGLEAWVRRNRLDDRTKVTEARFVYVSLDENGQKRPIPGE